MVTGPLVEAVRTGWHSFGSPHAVSVTADGTMVTFLRSSGPYDPVAALWVLDVATGQERLLVEPAAAPTVVRERERRLTAGIAGYHVSGHTAVFTLDGVVHTASLTDGSPRSLGCSGEDPRLSPTAEHVAFVDDGALSVVDLAGRPVLRLPGEPGVSWGVPEFVAAEEFDRHEAFWWSPDGRRLLVARVDERMLPMWHLADPSHPEVAPRSIRYPVVHGPNAEVTLHLIDLAGGRLPVELPFEYLVAAAWDGEEPTVTVLDRTQTELTVWSVDATDGGCRIVGTVTDPCWADPPGGPPSPPGATVVVPSRSLDHSGVRWTVHRDGEPVALLGSRSSQAVRSRPALTTVTEHQLPAGVVKPRDHVAGRRLAVVLDVYGGPGMRTVVPARDAWLEKQWWADQGFAVVAVDNRGTPGLDERAIHRNLTLVLDDQIAALTALAAADNELDLSRVAIRGSSFGGWVAGLAVLRHPDLFRCGVAGAPVTDWALYDTAYTERYLGSDPEVLRAHSLVTLAGGAAASSPLLLIHGLTDDNVVAAHSFRLAEAFREADRPVEFIPLPGSHVIGDPAVVDRLMRHQLAFVRRHTN